MPRAIRAQGPPSPRPHVVVVGGGIGGLVAAVELAHHGTAVTLLERAPRVGGKIRQIDLGGRHIDVGPTVLTMRWVLDTIFADLGAKVEDHLTLHPLPLLARHIWEDGSQLDLFTDIERSAAAVEAFAGSRDADGFRAFCRYAQKIYENAEAPFIRAQRPSLATFFGTFGLRGLARLGRIDGMRSMWKALGDFFADPRLRQLFGRYATYYGSSPFRAPATLNLIAHIEMQGVWVAEGGMHGVAQAVAHLAAARGVEIECGRYVTGLDVRGGRVRGVRLDDGTQRVADAVVVNADVAALAGGRFGTEAAQAVKLPKGYQRSLSALTFATVAPAGSFPLAYHNVFFSDAYEQEFADLFDARRLPRKPTVYLCAQDRLGPVAAGADERLFGIVNAPARGDTQPLSTSELEACERRTLAHLERCGLRLGMRPELRARFAPADFDRAFPATGGALYGPATHSWKTPMQRAAARTRLPGLYIASGSAHPGAGVPMSALGGRMAAARVLEDVGDTHLSPPVGMCGGRSTV